ncbi:MAG: hypothetical protein AAB913_01365 [Patescibacteria group bacterium]
MEGPNFSPENKEESFNKFKEHIKGKASFYKRDIDAFEFNCQEIFNKAFSEFKSKRSSLN